MSALSAFLQECDLFYNLTETQLEMVAKVCEEKLCRKGELIFEENSTGKELYLILAGSVEILLNPGLVTGPLGMKNAPEVIAVFRRGQSFGEMALIDEGVRSASAASAEDGTHLVVIHRKKFLLLCGMYPELGYRVMQNLSSDLARKIRSADFKIREALMYRQSQSDQ